MEQEELIRYTVDLLARLSIPYMVVGSVASAAYGEPRFTQDIDIVVAIDVAHLPMLVEAFPEADFYLSHEAAIDAILRRGQFNVIHMDSGNKIDFMIARDDAWGREQVQRRRLVNIVRGTPGYAATPEDIILSKLLYYQEGQSEKHLRDIAGILRVSEQRVDRNYVSHWAQQLGVAELWQHIERREKGLGTDASLF